MLAVWVHLAFVVFYFASVTPGILFSYSSIIFCEFYFHDSEESRETHTINTSRILMNLQYLRNVLFCIKYVNSTLVQIADLKRKTHNVDKPNGDIVSDTHSKHVYFTM